MWPFLPLFKMNELQKGCQKLHLRDILIFIFFFREEMLRSSVDGLFNSFPTNPLTLERQSGPQCQD
jgi:hypothetical protein